MPVHSDPVSSKCHAFDLQSEALLAAIVSRQSDPPSSTHHAMPRESRLSLQGADGQAGRPRESRGRRHLTVGDDPSSRHACDNGSDPSERGQLSGPRSRFLEELKPLHLPVEEGARRRACTTIHPGPGASSWFP